MPKPPTRRPPGPDDPPVKDPRAELPVDSPPSDPRDDRPIEEPGRDERPVGEPDGGARGSRSRNK